MAGKKMVKKKAANGVACRCPYCETEIMVVQFPLCQICGLEVYRCLNCLVVLPKDAKTCPNCGKAIE